MVPATSLFDLLLQAVAEFSALVKKHNAERAAKGFSCRTQLVAMLFCQLAHLLPGQAVHLRLRIHGLTNAFTPNKCLFLAPFE